MATSDRLRLGIIGIGMYALTEHVPAIRATGLADLVAISRRNPEALAQAKQALEVPEAYTNWQDMLEHSKLDGVIVATSHSSHAAPAIAALELGLPVLVEKPLAASSADAWAIVRAAESSGRTLMVGHELRCNGLLRTAKRLLTEGAIGNVEQIVATYDQGVRWVFEWDSLPAAHQQQILSAYLDQMGKLGVPSFVPERVSGHWRADAAQMGGGLFADTGAHLISLALWLGGAPPSTVVALSEPKGKPVERYLNATARLANGVITTVTANNGTDVCSRVTVIGDGGTLTGERPRLFYDLDLWLQRGDRRERVSPDHADLTAVAAFVATVLDGAPNLSPAADAAHVVEFSEAAYRSALEERFIRIESPDSSALRSVEA